MGVVSAASLNITEVGLASEGVKNYTEANGNIPSFVEVADKNSSTPSFLKTLTKTTVQLNSGSTASVNISSVNVPTGPSGSATGTLYKSEYVMVANNVYNYIDSNGRAPNYASSSLGNIRYEPLVYAYARIVNFHRVNARLPDSVSISNVVGVDSTGVVIDTVAPTMSSNLASGSYNTIKNVTLTATDHVDVNPKVYYSINDGTWNNKAKTVTLTLNQGVTTLKYYGRDAAGNQGVTQTAIYTIDTIAPTVTESDPVGGETNVIEDKIITVTFSKPVQAGSLWIELKNSLEAEIPIVTSINDTVLTIIPSTFLTADKYTLTLHTGSITDLIGNPLALWEINFNTTSLFTIDSVTDTAGTVKSHIDANHALPGNVTVSGAQVNMPQYLKLLTETVLNINNNSNADIAIGSYNVPQSPSENITIRDINKTEYLDIANRVKSYIDTNGRAPNYATQNSTGNTIRYESLIYMYTQILNSYNITGILPDYVTVNPWAAVPNPNIIGNTTYGYVEKEIYGNQNSSQTIALIIGVHPQENGIHTAIADVLANAVSLTKRYVLYYVHVTQNADNYSIGRMNGQLLAQQYIVPDVASENPILVLDNHENHGASSGYDYWRFLYPISNNTITANYCNEILGEIPFLVVYYPPNPTSPQYVTIPIANQGIPTIIYETYFYDPESKKSLDANAIIDALDVLGNTPNSSPTVAAIPKGGAFNTPKTVTLTNTNPLSVATIYYTLDGSNPQTISTRIEYTVPIAINSTKTIKFSAVDSEGNWSPIYSETYTLDTKAPTVKSVDPSNGAVNVPSTKVIKVTFSEPVQAGSLWIELKKSGTAVPFTTLITNNVLTITPTKQLLEGRYSLGLHTGSVKDLADNNLAFWTINFNTTNAFTLNSINTAAKTMKSYVETNHKLPSSVTISGTQVNMRQFLKLSGEAILNIAGTLKTSFTIGSYAVAPSPSETMTIGIINSTEYKNIAKRVNTFMNSNGRAPNYASSSLGNIRYESLIYIYSEILNSYNSNGVLPYFIIADPWAVVKNTNTVFYSEYQVNDAASRVKSFVETNHRLPSYVTISGKQVSMPSYLKLAVTNLLNIEGSFYASIVLQSCGEAPDPEENITNKNMGELEYVKIASNVRTFMDKDIFGRAPNYATTSFGKMRFESLVYMYSQLLDYYNSTDYLPETVAVTSWSSVSNTNTVFFTVDQINSAAGTVKSYVETNHNLPSSVNIAGKQVTMPQFLQLSTEALLSIEGSLCSSFVPRNYDTATGPSESVMSRDSNYTEYLDFAKRVNSFMSSNGRAPNYITQNSTGSTIRYESLVYMYAQILNSYKNTNETLPDYITVNPWSVVSNSNTVFLSMDQINSAAGTLKSYIESNRALPSNITISGRQVSMPQFLRLVTTTLLNIEGDLNTSIVLKSVGNPVNSTEDIACGDITLDEYIYIAQYAKNYINSNGTAPSYAYQTSLGTHMGFKSLVYMYAHILNSYKTNNETLPVYVTVTPWVAVSNPGLIYNFQSGKVFNNLQAAIDDADTKGGEFIGIGKVTVSENVILNKKLTIMPIPTVEVTIQAANLNLPVFTITAYGSGSIIWDLIIKGSTNNAGIFINNSYYNTILGNNIYGNKNGIYIFNSTDNQIVDSEILNNTMNGILIDTGSDSNRIIGNTLTGNRQNGMNINNSNSNVISNNIISHNCADGIYLNSSSTQINFNRITGNTRYGLYNTGNGTVDANNNWWGSSNPIISSNSPSDIYIDGGTVSCDKWLVLSVTSSADRADCTGATYKYRVTADLTRNNHGEDTSSGSSNVPVNLPDGIPVNFTTTFGTINTSVSTRSGKSAATLNSTAAGNANVTVTLDNQSITVPISIKSVNTLGVLNTRTGEYFSSIQSAIDSNNTLDGDTITLADGTYTENVVVYKKLTIKSVSEANVTVQAADSSIGVFTIVESGSTIQNISIIGAADAYGIFSYADHVNIIGNTISANYYGISLVNSNYNVISGNMVIGNWYGINIFNSNNNVISENSILDNWYGIYFYNSTSIGISENNITGNWYGITLSDSDSVTIYENIITDSYCGVSLSNCKSTTIYGNTITGNAGGINYYNSTNTISGNTIIDNRIVDISELDTTGVVIQSNIWNCGPASLATVLKMLGITTTQEDLADLAGTDEEGTTMYGLFDAALRLDEDLNAVGMILPVTELRPGFIVLLEVNGLYHFSVIKSINSTTVCLADSAFGNINMTLDDFTAMFSGYTLIVTKNSTNITANGTILTNPEMQEKKGTFIFLAIPAIVVSPYVIAGAVAIAAVGIGAIYALQNWPKSTANNSWSNLLQIARLGPIYLPGRTKYRTPPSGYRYIPGRGYVSSTGYISSPVSLIDMEYQNTLDDYLKKQASQAGKIIGIISQNQEDWDLNRKTNKMEEAEEFINKAYRDISAGRGDGDDKKIAEFFNNLYKWSKGKIKDGVIELRAGNYMEGMKDITLGTFGFDIWGSLLASYLVDQALPT